MANEPQIVHENALRETLSGIAGLQLAYLFGSRVNGRESPQSDCDIALLLETPSPGLEREEQIRHALCLSLHSDNIDMVVLNQAPIELAFVVIAEGKVLFQQDLASRVEYEADVLSRYYDYLPTLRSQREEILKGGHDDTRVQWYRTALERTLRALEQARSSAR
jgi:predicted nucleotidyltransferase